VQIRVHDDHLRIWNPGQLPEHWTVDKLLKPHASQPFNPDIANAFFRAGEIEAWGRGIQRIFEVCKAHGVPSPAIDYTPGDFSIEFAYAPEYLAVATTVETPVETRVEAPVKTPEQILAALAATPEMTLAELAVSIGKSLSAVERAAAKLVKEKRLRFVGPRKGGRWEVMS
jgi:ATP-dependent DNA helicase RecG